MQLWRDIVLLDTSGGHTCMFYDMAAPSTSQVCLHHQHILQHTRPVNFSLFSLIVFLLPNTNYILFKNLWINNEGFCIDNGPFRWDRTMHSKVFIPTKGRENNHFHVLPRVDKQWIAIWPKYGGILCQAFVWPRHSNLFCPLNFLPSLFPDQENTRF